MNNTLENILQTYRNAVASNTIASEAKTSAANEAAKALYLALTENTKTVKDIEAMRKNEARDCQKAFTVALKLFSGQNIRLFNPDNETAFSAYNKMKIQEKENLELKLALAESEEARLIDSLEIKLALAELAEGVM